MSKEILSAGSISTVALAWCIVCAPAPASAQDMSKPDGVSATSIGDIVVTARKRTERLIDVPAVISVLDQEALARYATTNFESLGTQVPQVMLSKGVSGTGAIVTIRGIGSNAAGDDSIEQAVSFSIDGVSSARGRLITQALFDLSNVQVLKGPQALYFGKNSPGGVVVVESNNPGDKLEGYVTGGYEFKTREYKVEGAIGGPLTDTLGFRVAAYRSDMMGGYIRNTAGPTLAANSPVALDRALGLDQPGRSYKWGPGSKQVAGRGTLVWKPSSDFDATLKLLGTDYRDHGETSIVSNISCPAGSPVPIEIDLGAAAFGLSPTAIPDPYGSCGERRQSIGALNPTMAATYPKSNGGKPYLHSRSYLGSLTANYDLAQDVQLTSVTGYYKNSVDQFTNFDLTAFDLIPATFISHVESWTQELRISTRATGPFNFNGGLFYSHDKRDYRGVSGLVRSFNPANGSFVSYDNITRSSGRSYSAFGELSWKFAPGLELAGGARFTDERKRADLQNLYLSPLLSAFGIALPVADAEGVPNVVRGRYHETNVSPQVTLTWHPTENTTVFAGYRTGFKSGGVSNPGFISAAQTADNAEYGSEKARGYEVGVKFSALDRRLNGDFTLYNYRYKGLQLIIFESDTASSFVKNAGGAETSGVEGSLSFKATDMLELRSNFGYNRSRYSTFPNAPCWAGQTAALGCNTTLSIQNLGGRPLSRAPKWTANAGATYDVPMSADVGLSFSADGRYTSSYFTSVLDSPFGFQKGYVVFDASIRLHSTESRWDLMLVGKNLTSKKYVVYSTEVPIAVQPGSEQGIIAAPRQVTLQATYRF